MCKSQNLFYDEKGHCRTKIAIAITFDAGLSKYVRAVIQNVCDTQQFQFDNATACLGFDFETKKKKT